MKASDKKMGADEARVAAAAPDPCRKDERLCDLHAAILAIFRDCFSSDRPDLRAAASCANDILNLINSFNAANPGYRLLEIFNSQISIIKAFISRPTEERYNNAKIAIQFILDELYKMGDCGCGEGGGDGDPVFTLKDTASIQSPDFYLQAAGSLGVESTKGIHLRWMLKGALSNHLPKADYATPGVNFNKVDDYVRIYRSPYIATSLNINFETRPQMVDSAQFQWLYQAGTNAVYIHFLNTAKYNQVLSIIDPLANPLDFIKEYGDNVIEVEHKSSLSFSVTIQLEITTGSGNTFIELLSVEENKITAPKSATFRKHYTTTSISGVKLLSENIRSVRLKAKGGHLKQVQFELYSDFLAIAEERRSWTYMGKYALTKDTPTAYSRLEPTTNSVNGKWLRYNDDAYVNIANYQDKWNGAGLPPENRILNTVDTYITLSDVASNPQAIETFLINDPGVSMDPDYDPSDDEFELSNLYVLQLAALDYHIARMLGLGTLDMDATVYTGTYMYLAEYYTLAPLEEGGETGEVQHLYCSLPTRLADQRLPLPVDLKEPVSGIIQGLDTEAPAVITDPDGYSFDGKTRFLSLFNEELPEELENQSFYYTNYEFISADLTLPVYAGIEYRRTGNPNWVKPELPYDRNYLNIDATVPVSNKNETKSIVIPESQFPLYVHREKDNGWHDYSSYGINWFSRATDSTIIQSIETTIVPTNNLQPPTNINSVLIRPESPLFLTSETEQDELSTIIDDPGDNTFIRLTFEYNHGQELIDYHRTINGDVINGYVELADIDELFGDDIEIFYRNRVPVSVSGKVVSVTDYPGNPLLSNIQSGQYEVISAGPSEFITPSIANDGSNFVGSVLSVDGADYIIHLVDNSGTYPKFTIFKNDQNGFPINLGSATPPSELTAPSAGGLFLAVENMLTDTNWSLPDASASTPTMPLPEPLAFTVNIDHTTVYREEITITTTDGIVETHAQKFRGVYENAFIEKQLEDHDGDAGTPDIHNGLYKLTFTGFALAQHSQGSGSGHRVEWYNGVIRLHTQGDPNGPRRELKVIRTENIGTVNDLIVYAVDSGFDTDVSYDQVQIGTQLVNYYPGYKTYLFHDPLHNLEESKILPAVDEGERYSIFGLRTHDAGLGYYSKISVPVLMFALEIVEPQQPRLPNGGLYATRPDFFGKASYTFRTIFEHKPYSVQFNRASDIQILSAVYKIDELDGPGDYNVESIILDIFENRESEWLQDRWYNFISWDYTSDSGLFEELAGVRMPLPNNETFIASINTFIDEHNAFYGESVPHVSTITSMHQIVIPSGAGHGELQLVDFFRDIIFNCFVPLTEIPVIYKYIKDATYTPIPKKQLIRDRNGNLLNPNAAEFDMAPMMKITGTGSPNHEAQFTDFGLDGASNAKYFYAVREMNLQMKMGPYSPILGPISLVNTSPPKAPEIVKITPRLENLAFGIPAGIEVSLNGYSKTQNIKKINVYRTLDPTNALSIRTMDMVSEQNIDLLGIQDDQIWVISDDFSDLGYVPYGDPLFYKIVVQREIKYIDKTNNLIVDYAPSAASKMTLTNIVENSNPQAPTLSYYSTAPTLPSNDISSVTFEWNKTVHNGTYTIHKMNASGNWEQIHEVRTNDSVIYVELTNTSWGTDVLETEDDDGKPIYHHFKIIAKNFAGMISREEKILTIYNPDTWQDVATL